MRRVIKDVPYSIKGYGSGTVNYISVPSSANWNLGTADWTMLMVLRTPTYMDSGGTPILIDHQNTGTSGGFELYLDYASSLIRIRMNRNSVNALLTISTPTLTKGNWHEIVVSRIANSHQVYVDGVAVGTPTVDANTMDTVTGALRIGNYPSGTYAATDAAISRVRINKGYGYTATDVSNSYYNAVDNNTGLVLDLKPLTGSGTTVTDVSDQALNGTMNGALAWTAESPMKARTVVAQKQNLVADSTSVASWGTNTGVTKSANTTDVLAPDGTYTAYKFVYNGSDIAGAYRAYLATSISTGNRNVNYTTAVWICISTGTRPMIYNTNTFGVVNFTVTTTWQRIESNVLWSAPSSAVVLDLFDGAGQNSAFTFYLWQPSCVRANWVGPFCPTTGSVIDTGNIRNKSTTRTAVAQKQNYLLYSQSIGTSPWNLVDTGGVASLNSIVAPDGTTTATDWTFPTSSAYFAYGHQNLTGVFDASKPWTFSVWAKVPTGTQSMTISISNTTISTSTSGVFTLNTVWQKLVFKMPAGAIVNTGIIGVGFGSVTAGAHVHLWGAQLVNANREGVYTPTVGAVVDTGNIRNLA